MSTNNLSQVKQQLALAIQLNDEISFADFCWNGNELIQQQILPILSSSERFFYIWGASGAGKSHLLQAYCQEWHPNQYSVMYLPLKVLHSWGPAILEGAEKHHVIAMDDIDCIAGQKDWEEAVFHLYNRIQDRQHILMLTSQLSPLASAIQLPDLRSRLTATLVLHLHELTDEYKIKTLQTHAQKRGLELPLSVAQYIINHCTRNMHDLQTILNHLDHASLVAQHKLTIPFVKNILVNDSV
ncbi:MAG TPA: DnaA regulatory inactivator Hda [Legionellaceae bacterium]|nr:DnaA regulatory inactivator Hda [Legionellaceae bacterium]